MKACEKTIVLLVYSQSYPCLRRIILMKSIWIFFQVNMYEIATSEIYLDIHNYIMKQKTLLVPWTK